MDYRIAAPSVEQVAALTDELEVRPEFVPDDPSISRMTDWLRGERRKGGAEIAGFRIAENPVFDWFVARRRLDSQKAIEAVLAHSIVRESLPHFRIENPISYSEKAAGRLRGWNLVWPFQVPGEWAMALDSGGFYVDPDKNGRSAREDRAAAAMDTALASYRSLTGNRFLPSISAYFTSDPWCDWFPGLFNGTWIIFDDQERLLWMLAITDMD